MCRDSLTDPVRVVVGELGEANTDITQIAELMRDEKDKWTWLLRHLVEFTSGSAENGFNTCICLSVSIHPLVESEIEN